MFGNYFKHVLVLTLLAGLTYSLPQVKDAMAGAFTIGYSDASAYTAAVGDAASKVAISQVSIQSISAKVNYDSMKKESGVLVTAKVKIAGGQSGIVIPEKGSFLFVFTNKTLTTGNKEVYLPVTESSATRDSASAYIIKSGTAASFTVSGLVPTANMIAGQYTISLVNVVTTEGKITVPLNKSNAVVIVGENSPYIKVAGPGLYGSRDTIILNTVRLGKNPTITFKSVLDICEIGHICSPSLPKTFSLNGNNNSKQVKFDLTGKDLVPAQYQVYVTNNELGSTVGKSNIVQVQILDQSKLLTGKVIAGKLELLYDSSKQEVSLAAHFEATIKAGDTDLTFDQNSFFVRLDSNAYSTSADTRLVSVDGKTVSFPYTLKAKKEARLLVLASANPKILIGGVYTMSVGGISASTNAGAQKVYIQVNDNITKSLPVMGEVSPFLNQVSGTAIIGKAFTITGQRLAGATVYVDGAQLVCDANVTCVKYAVDGSAIEIDLPSSLQDGSHMLYVRNATTGQSNNIWFQSVGNVTCPPGYTCTDISTINVTSPSGSYPAARALPVVWTQNYVSENITAIIIGATNGDQYYQGPLGNGKTGTNTATLPREAANIPAGNYTLSVCDMNISSPTEPGKPLCSSTSFSIIPSPIVAPSVSASSATLGAPIMSGNTVVAYPATFKFTMSSNSTVYVSSNPNIMLTTQISGYVGGETIETPISVVSTNPATVAGDASSYFIIPAGTSREFTFNGVIRPGSTGGAKVIGITGVNYGTTNSVLTSNAIVGDLQSLKLVANFPISPPSRPFIQVLTPNGGEALVKGNHYQITWYSNIATSSTVHIGIKRCPSCYDDVNFDAPNTGSYDWTVGLTPFYPPVDQPGYQIKIVGGDYRGSADDVSDGYFSISTSTPARSITALTPASNVTWTQGQFYPITWRSTNPMPTDTVKVWLKNAAGTYYSIVGADGATLALPNTGSANITIPNNGTIPAGIYSIEYRFGPAVKSVAPGMVTIVAPVPCVPMLGNICEI